MKISELNQKSFLSGPNAANQSFVLVNYEDETTSKPITYRVSIEELGRAIANNLQLYKKTNNGAITISVDNGEYVNNTAERFITAADLPDITVPTKLSDLQNDIGVLTAHQDISNVIKFFTKDGYTFLTTNGTKAGVIGAFYNGEPMPPEDWPDLLDEE